MIRIGRVADADMPVGVEDSFVDQDAIGGHEFFKDGRGRLSEQRPGREEKQYAKGHVRCDLSMNHSLSSDSGKNR